MRRTRRFILVLLALVIAGVAIIYSARKSIQARTAPPPPRSLPDAVSARADDWTYEQTRDGKPFVRVRARDQQMNAEGTRVDLTGVELHIFGADSSKFDRVRSGKANFDLTTGVLFSDGEVEITMGVPADSNAPAPASPVIITTSGVRLESKTGKAFTDRPAAFRFDRGDGRSVGAQYDPELRELQMHKDVKLRWFGQDAKGTPMEIEAGSLLYKEASSEILLSEWSKFRRDTLTMEGGNALVRLKDDAIESIDAFTARGIDKSPGRTVDYAADLVHARFNEDGILQAVSGDRNARLLSATDTATTTVRSSKIDMDFTVTGKDSLLRTAVATGDVTVDSNPVPRPGRPPADTRVLKSEAVSLFMRPGGKDMERVETGGPGRLDFIPNRPGGRKRTVEGQHLKMEYGPGNELNKFIALDASTRTESPAVKGKTPPPALTWSKGLAAHFDEKTGALAHLEQWENFRYQEGDRRAKADRADLYSPADDIVLTGSARVWDPAGSTSADRITMRQKSDEFEAMGNVSSTRQPDGKKGGQTGMMSGEEPVQARAGRMVATENNSVITYEGDALLWQGSNRITGQIIRIDRRTNSLSASGRVVTQLVDKSEKTKNRPVFTVVKAPEMTWDDKERLAHYTGGAVLTRAGMVVSAKEIRAWMKSGNTDSSLDRAFADGAVKIVQSAPSRSRTGASEHAEYYTEDGRILLTGGQPEFQDSAKGTTRGDRITYWTTSERFLVEGAEKKPVESKILRRRG